MFRCYIQYNPLTFLDTLYGFASLFLEEIFLSVKLGALSTEYKEDFLKKYELPFSNFKSKHGL